MASRERFLMDFDWKFKLGDIPLDEPHRGWLKSGDFKVSGANPDLDDSSWRDVDLPHDFVIEGEFTEFHPDYYEAEKIRPDKSRQTMHVLHGSLRHGIGWYRKRFKVARKELGRRFYIEFDGVYRNCEVYLNAHFVGKHLSGYTSFHYDATDIINYGSENLLAVKVDAREYEGWFYEGGGIYRHSWIVKTDPVHVAPWGTFVMSDVTIRDGRPAAVVNVETQISNRHSRDIDCELVSVIVDHKGKKVGRTASRVSLEEWSNKCENQEVGLKDVHLWSVESPVMYRLVTTVKVEDEVVDEYETPFGIRKITFDANRGFLLNNEPVKMKGVCCHQDHAGVGSALPDALQEFRIRRLKEMGCNAYRTAHNPPTPELLDACDRLGMLVMDETRLTSSSDEYTGQLESLVRRDRNHPSVVMWSIGNEESLIHGKEVGARIARTLRNVVRKLDMTRPVTLAMSRGWDDCVVNEVDVMGFNYQPETYDDFHKRHPDMPIVASESCSTVGTRGIYTEDPGRGYVPAYDSCHPEWGIGAESMWKIADERPWLCGEFVWTGFDYRGEPTPYLWPCISSHFGIIDLCGFPKDNFFYYKSWWGDDMVLHVFPHWNWPGMEGKRIDVWCHTNCDEVELFLNGKSLGKKKVKKNIHLEWKVKYHPGTIEAKGWKGVRLVETRKIETTGSAFGIRLTPDRDTINADNEDVALVAVEVLDEKARFVATADNEIEFRVEGPGRIIGVGNGDPSSHEPNKSDRRRVFNGLCQVIVQSTREPGKIRLTATSRHLRSTAITIIAKESPQRPWVRPVRPLRKREEPAESR